MTKEKNNPVRCVLRKMHRDALKQFEVFQREGSYITNRHFFPVPGSDDRDTKTFIVEELPKFQGLGCDEWITRKIAQSNGVPVEVYDIGCGYGQAIKDIKRKHLQRVNVAGMTATREPVDKRAISRNVCYLNRYVRNGSIDVAYSYMALHYTKVHVARHIKNVYQILKPDGVAFLYLGYPDDFWLNEIDGLCFLENWLAVNGYDFEFDTWSTYNGKRESVVSCSFRKPKDRLDKILLPLTYNERGFVYFDQEKAGRYSELLKVSALNNTNTLVI